MVQLVTEELILHEQLLYELGIHSQCIIQNFDRDYRYTQESLWHHFCNILVIVVECIMARCFELLRVCEE
jgi:hypothetical protein